MSHDPDEVAILIDTVGVCEYCKHHTVARLVAYYSREIVIRCGNCKRASTFVPGGENNKFTPDDKSFSNPKKFEPFLNDEDDEKPYNS